MVVRSSAHAAAFLAVSLLAGAPRGRPRLGALRRAVAVRTVCIQPVFEPEHRSVRLAARFFEKRFSGMDWSILTPQECAHWNGRALHFTPGVSRRAAPDDDGLDHLWRTYYRSIFNPARLKVRAMQSEMPKKYWKNLPEAPLIAELIAESSGRVGKMLRAEERPARPAPKDAYLDSLREKNAPDPSRPDDRRGHP